MGASSWRQIVGLALLSGVPIACTALLGDDFVITVSGEGGSTTASTAAQGSGGAGAAGGTGGSAIGAPCDAAIQDCAGGLKCLPQEPPPGICARNGSLAEGAACTAMHPNADSDDCAADLLCVQDTCQRLCDPSRPVCSDGMSNCMTHAGNFGVCLPWCDPLAQDCGTGMGCFLVSPAFVCIPAVGGLTEGQACMYLNDCAPGLFCASEIACGLPNGCCKPLCDVTMPASMYCSGTDMCVGLEAPAPYAHVGGCVVP